MANLARRHQHKELVPTFDTWIDDFFSGGFPQMMNRLMPASSANLPAVNISESHEGFHLEMATPGFQKGDLHVSLQERNLVISGEKKQESKGDEHNLRRQEFSCATFRRVFSLPDNVVKDKLLCAYEDGVLKLDLPKSHTGTDKGTREIPIK